VSSDVQGDVGEQKACLKRDGRVNQRKFTNTVLLWKDPLK